MVVSPALLLTPQVVYLYVIRRQCEADQQNGRSPPLLASRAFAFSQIRRRKYNISAFLRTLPFVYWTRSTTDVLTL